MCIFLVWAICSRQKRLLPESRFSSLLNFSVRKISTGQLNSLFEEVIGLFVIAESLQAFAEAIGRADVMIIDL